MKTKKEKKMAIKTGKRQLTVFGKEVYCYLIRREKSVEEMANHLGVSRPFLNMVLNGKKLIPKDWVRKLPKALRKTAETEIIVEAKRKLREIANDRRI